MIEPSHLVNRIVSINSIIIGCLIGNGVRIDLQDGPILVRIDHAEPQP